MFKPKDRVWKVLSGGGFVTKESAVILRVDESGVWLDNGSGNDPSGPFDVKTGLAEPLMPGWQQHITHRTAPTKAKAAP